jgi:hypothetical protein
MKIVKWFPGLDRPVNISTFGLASLWFPLSVIHLSERWSHPAGFYFYFWLISTLLYLRFWPLSIVILMRRLKIHWLWATVVFAPLALLAFSLAENLSNLAKVMAVVSMAAPWPFLIMNSRPRPAAESQASAEPSS